MKQVIIVTLACVFIFNGTIYANLDNSLVAYYLFNSNANDETGNGYNGTVFGATATNDRFGNPNSAYEFDGNSNYIRVEDSFAFDFSDFTYSVWIFPFIHAGTRPIIDLNDDQQLLALSDGQYSTLYRCGTDSHGTVPDNWCHVVWIVSGENYKLYSDGNIVGAGNNCSLGVDASSLMIGSDFSENMFFNGKIDDVRIYSRALSDAEIQQIYRISLEIPESVWEFDGLLENGGTVSISDLAQKDLSINLTSSDTSEVILPSTVTILAGYNSVTFDITIIDDEDNNPSHVVTVIATSIGYGAGTAIIEVKDDDDLWLPGPPVCYIGVLTNNYHLR